MRGSSVTSQRRMNEATAKIVYNPSVPYEGGGTVNLSNHGSSTISINSYSWTDNNFIVANTPGQAPSQFWGTLAPVGTTIESVTNADGTYTHTFSLAYPLNLEPGVEYGITFQSQGSSGVLRCVLPPSDVQVRTGADFVPVAIQGLCVTDCTDPDPSTRRIGYYTSWTDYHQPIATSMQQLIEGQYNRALLFGAIEVGPSGSLGFVDSSKGSLQVFEFYKLQQLNPGRYKLGFSLGGADSANVGLGKALANPEARANLLKNTLALVEQLGTEIISIDLEPLSAENAPNLQQFLLDLTKGAQVAGVPLEIHAELPANPSVLASVFTANPGFKTDLEAAGIRFVPMTTDYYGGWDDRAYPDTPTYAGEGILPNPSFTVNGTLSVLAAEPGGVASSSTYVSAYVRKLDVSGMGEAFGLGETLVKPTGSVCDYSWVHASGHCDSGTATPSDLSLLTPETDPIMNAMQTGWWYSAGSKIVGSVDTPSTVGVKVDLMKSLGGGGDYAVFPLQGDMPWGPSSLACAASSFNCTAAPTPLPPPPGTNSKEAGDKAVVVLAAVTGGVVGLVALAACAVGLFKACGNSRRSHAAPLAAQAVDAHAYGAVDVAVAEERAPLAVGGGIQ